MTRGISRDIRQAQQTLAENARQIDLPQSEIIRIRNLDFTESEVARIEEARTGAEFMVGIELSQTRFCC